MVYVIDFFMFSSGVLLLDGHTAFSIPLVVHRCFCFVRAVTGRLYRIFSAKVTVFPREHNAEQIHFSKVGLQRELMAEAVGDPAG